MRSDRRLGRALTVVGAGLLLTLVSVRPLRAAAALDETLVRLFPPPASVTRDTLYLTDDQARAVEALAGTPLPSKIVTRYIGRRPDGGDAGPLGIAYVETHLVRTLPETLLIVVTPAGRVARVEVLTFREPREYLPSERWLQQFDDRELSPELQLKRAIRTLSGATLSSRAATEAVRRALAVHQVVGTGRGDGR